MLSVEEQFQNSFYKFLTSNTINIYDIFHFMKNKIPLSFIHLPIAVDKCLLALAKALMILESPFTLFDRAIKLIKNTIKEVDPKLLNFFDGHKFSYSQIHDTYCELFKKDLSIVDLNDKSI